MNHITNFVRRVACCVLAATSCFLVGCQSSSPDSSTFRIYESITQQKPAENATVPKSLVLHEGDSVRVTFPGSTNLNSVQQIRRDGRITLELAGEVTAAGLTPSQLEQEIIRLCGPQLISKEVVVSVDSSSFPVFVTGAVIRPGKIMSDRPMTALQAIMEAGGFDYTKANLASVRIIRQEGTEVKTYKINLKLTLQGKPGEPFDLKPADIVYVPEKFSWF